MTGKLVSIFLLAAGAISGVAIYYLQVHAFYEDVSETDAQVVLTGIVSNEPEEILFENFEAIDADSSPIRYRACFTTPMSLSMLTETYEAYEGAVPKNAPNWFDCFDAEAIGAEIENGNALVFTGIRNLEFGIDRVVAISADGRGYVWHEVNECGDKSYDSSPLGDDCPEK